MFRIHPADIAIEICLKKSAHFRFPFDTKYPFGYLIGIFIQYILVMYASFIMACSASIGIGSYLLVILAVKDMKHILRAINKQTKIKSEQSKISELFTEFIGLHSVMKQFSKLDHYGEIGKF